ncbi:monovalent cation/H+ antiporter complex subunit F [Spirochaeta lutea]|uniref:pH regulation protein F n=1 Tax=Spirochaeta lutea TaxID=1480694 RepID=A0A098QVB9_9SPIO|nr:monovalent cation/H+ antiporter complex subunit F [Spirochaeta lutea]KGE71679.1 pH regulation protein F [Spirochaeta lutea]
MREFMLEAMQWILAGASAAVFIRLIIGPTGADRLVALNILSGLALAFLVTRGVAQGRALYLDVALVYDIFGFLGFLAIARFLKDKISDEDGSA